MKYADFLTHKLTGFDSFQQMLDAKGSYRPSMDMRIKGFRRLAQLYDRAQWKRNDPRRTYRYGF